jgi:hypothetical protein
MSDPHDPGGLDDLDRIRLDEEFIRGGVYEPPARTRAAIAKYGDAATSWRQAAPVQPGRDAAKRETGRSPARSRPAPHARTAASARSRETRLSPVFVGLLGWTAAFGLVLWAQATRITGFSRFAIFCFVLGGWMISLCLHEYSHARMGYHGGDDSVATKGYLRLDPRRYQHPLLSFVVPVVMVVAGGIGFPGGAVWIDRGAIRSRAWRSLVSLAGPATNAVCAAVCLAPFALNRLFVLAVGVSVTRRAGGCRG